MPRQHHYGLEIGDKVLYDTPGGPVMEGEVTHLYSLDNNRCQIQIKGSAEIIDATCEWCKKIKSEKEVPEETIDKVIEKVVKMEIPGRLEKIANSLYEICDNVHASCDSECPIFFINGCVPLEMQNNGYSNCSCFKNGKKMIEFIKENAI